MTTTNIQRKVMVTKLKEKRAASGNQEAQKNFQEMQDTLKIISNLKSMGLISQPQFNVALHGEVIS